MSGSVDEDLGADVRVAVRDDLVDVAEHAGDVLVDVEDRGACPARAGSSTCGKFTAPVVAPVLMNLISAVDDLAADRLLRLLASSRRCAA